MQDISLQAKSRDTGKKTNKELRENGLVPGVVYGQGKEAMPVAVPVKELEGAYMTAGSNRLVGLEVDDGKPVNTLFVDTQQDPVTGSFLHFDLYKVRMDEKIEAEIPIHFENDAPATYNLDGVLVKNLETIEVSALPDKLPESFTVDLVNLEEINAAVHVSDLDIPEGVELITDEEELVVKIDPPRSEEELEELDEAIDEDAESAVESEHGAEEEGDEEDEEGAESTDEESKPEDEE